MKTTIPTNKVAETLAPAAQMTPPVQASAEMQEGGGAGFAFENVRVQRKLEISEPGDKDEQEAERMAERVMRMAESPQSEVLTPVGRRAEQRSALFRGDGHALASSERSFFEPRFGADFGGVRIHADADAAESARVMRARAYTVGSDIAFASGQYSPGTQEGRQLLAHELTHVVQQGGEGGSGEGGHIQRQSTASPDDILLGSHADALGSTRSADATKSNQLPVVAELPRRNKDGGDGSLIAGITNFEFNRSSAGVTADLINIIYLVANDQAPGVPKKEVERLVHDTGVSLRQPVQNGKGYVRASWGSGNQYIIHLNVILYIDIVDNSEVESLIMKETNPCVSYVYVINEGGSYAERNFDALNQGIITTSAIQQNFLSSITHYAWHKNDARYRIDTTLPGLQYVIGGHNNSNQNFNINNNRDYGSVSPQFDYTNSLMFGQPIRDPNVPPPSPGILPTQLLQSDFDALSPPLQQESGHALPLLFTFDDLVTNPETGQHANTHMLGRGVLHHVFSAEEYNMLLRAGPAELTTMLAALEARGEIVPNPDRVGYYGTSWGP